MDLHGLLNAKGSGIPRHVARLLQEAIASPSIKEEHSHEMTLSAKGVARDTVSAKDEMVKKIDTMHALYIEKSREKRPSDYMEKLSSFESFWTYRDAFESEVKSKTCDALRLLVLYEGLVEQFQVLDRDSDVALPDSTSIKGDTIEKLEKYVKNVSKYYPKQFVEEKKSTI